MQAVRTRRLAVCLSAILFALLASVAAAQTSNTILLESSDTNVSISGQLIEAVNGQYRVQTLAGLLEIDINDVACSGNGCPSVEPNFVAGAPVNLVSSDGDVNITGNIVSVFNDQYVIGNSVAGIIRLDTDSVDCSGQGCPAGLRFSHEPAMVAAIEEPTDIEPEEISENAPEIGSEETAETKTFDPANASISFAGSDTIGLGLLPNLLDDYADTLGASIIKNEISESESFIRYTGPNGTELTSFYVDATGSGDAANALETKTAVFGMTSRAVTSDEAQRVSASGGPELRNSDFETVIAVDSLALVTHPSNPLREISMQELRAIYLGQIDNWAQLGGPDAPITVLSREDGSSTRGVFERVVFDGEQPTLAQRVVYPGGDNPEMAAAVNADPNAIGYVGFAYSNGLSRLDLRSSCGIVSSATSFAVKTEEYPLTRRLYLYNRGDNMPSEAEQFLQYVLSSDADDAVAKSNFVNAAVERRPHDPLRSDIIYENLDLQSSQQLLLAEVMQQDLPQWDRLSTTLRFRTGSSQLDKKALNDINRLIGALGSMPENTQIAVVGFTDDIGLFEQNLRLSRLRAQRVVDSIATIGGDRLSNVQIDTKSYAELSPSVCNDGAIGRAINRRVEIWVRK